MIATHVTCNFLSNQTPVKHFGTFLLFLLRKTFCIDQTIILRSICTKL